MPRAAAAGSSSLQVGRWLALAVGSLILAGLFSLTIVLARMPPFDRLVTDPGFFKRCLVVHVVLALVVWFYAFLAALFGCVPGPARPSPWARHAPLVAALGVLLLVAGAGVPGAAPVLSNYVPVIDHPVFFVGLTAVLVGLVLAFVDARVLPAAEAAPPAAPGPLVLPAAAPGPLVLPPAAQVALRAGAIAVLCAVLCFVASARATPSALPPALRFEQLFWGGGHVLQLASVAGMLAVWITLVARVTGRAPLGRGAATLLFAVYVAPVLLAPLAAGAGERLLFTRLMQFGIAPTVLVVLVLCLRTLAAARRERPGLLGDPSVLGLGASMALTLCGFGFGALIDGQNTVVPGHYHASIGAVTVAFMTISVPLLAGLGLPVRSPRLARLARVQPAWFGGGQLVFALGFVLAGAHGMARKSYGAEQAARGAAETVGLVIMGVGGLVAVAFGISYLVIVTSAWRGRARAEEARPWTRHRDHIGSRG